MLNSRYLLYEAQQAHYYGLPENLALASVISRSAEVMGMSHRVGFIKEGKNGLPLQINSILTVLWLHVGWDAGMCFVLRVTDPGQAQKTCHLDNYRSRSVG